MSGTKPFRLGLTGSIAMGKSTTAGFFSDAGVPVWDADATVHRLYARGGLAVPLVAELVPSAIVDGAVDRARLRAEIARDPAVLKRLENAVHPLVQADRENFIKSQTAPVVLLDIPLLFETGADAYCDAVVVVTAPPEVQHARALARPGMTEEALALILSRQLPDAEKRGRADYIIDTSQGLEAARDAVHSVLRSIESKPHA